MDIIVIGTRLKINKDSGGGGWLSYLEQGFDGEPNPTLSPEPGGEGGPYEEMPAAKDTPCVSASPDGHSLAEINNIALHLSNEIAKLNDDDWEYGAVIYSLNGVIGFTGIVTQQNPERVNYPMDQVPDGAIVLAVVHNHPAEFGVDDGYPSPHDWNTYERLGQPDSPLLENGRIAADPKMLIYVYTNEDHKTRVYDKDDKGQESNECALQ